jgi:hypothetical protein
MAGVTKREWWAPGIGGRRVKKTAYGFTLQQGGKQIRASRTEWSRQDAERELAKARLGLQSEASSGGLTFSEATARYLKVKASEGKQSLHADEQHLNLFLKAWGDVPLSTITTAKISAWQEQRQQAICPQTGQPYSTSATYGWQAYP